MSGQSVQEHPTKRARTCEPMAADAGGATARFAKQGFCGPVTALCWVSGPDVLLTGRGTDVLAARVAGSQQQHLGVMRLFANGRVHGIKGRVAEAGKVSDGGQRVLVAAHSEKNITLAELVVPHDAASEATAAPRAAVRVLAKLWELDDWVIDVQFLRGPGQALTAADAEADAKAAARGGDSEEWGWLAAGLAHNTVEIWDWQRQIRLRRVDCVERPVLFTMAMHGDDGDSLVVATGGFTREVLCWQVLGPKSGQPVQRLKGHTGVVHCVRWRSDGRALVSGSEDRSVRIWLAQADESGKSSAEGADGSKFPILVHADSLWGHAARIWECQITHDTVATVSEDSSGRVYKYQEEKLYQGLANTSPSARAGETAAERAPELGGQCISVLKGHQGKHVWKCVICTLATGGSVVATGGNDASTKIWATGGRDAPDAQDGGGGASVRGGGGGGVELPVVLDSYEVPFYPDEDGAEPVAASQTSKVDATSTDEQPVGRAGGKKGPREEFVRCCALLRHGTHVICGTNQGRAVRLVRETGGWSCLYKNSACQFTAVSVDEELEVAVLGDARGGLSVVSLSDAFAGYTFSAHHGHVMDVFFRRAASTGQPLVYSGDNAENAAGGGAIHRFTLDKTSGKMQKSCTIRCDAACRITCLVEVETSIQNCAVAVLGDRKVYSYS